MTVGRTVRGLGMIWLGSNDIVVRAKPYHSKPTNRTRYHLHLLLSLVLRVLFVPAPAESWVLQPARPAIYAGDGTQLGMTERTKVTVASRTATKPAWSLHTTTGNWRYTYQNRERDGSEITGRPEWRPEA